MAYYIGCDLGGTNLRAAIVDSVSGETQDLHTIPTQAHEGHEKVLARMADFFKDMIKKSPVSKEEIAGIGIGFPGSIDLPKGVTTFMTNLPDHWINVPVSEYMKEKTGLPTYILNDVRAITWGELKFGAGKGCSSMVCYALGTGIGGGIVVNGKLLIGNSGQAGELGHQTVEPHGNHCNCGNYGCLETYASGPAIRSMALKVIAHGGTSILGEMVDYDLNKMTPKVVCEAAMKGDAAAMEIYETAGYYLGIAISNSILTLEPERVVICGGVAAAGDLLFKPVRRVVNERVHNLVPLGNIQIVPGTLGDNAGVIGTSMWAEHNINLNI